MGFLEQPTLRVVVTALQHCLGCASARHFFISFCEMILSLMLSLVLARFDKSVARTLRAVNQLTLMSG